MTDLLPCPFCGSKAVQMDDPDYFSVGCDSDECLMNPSVSLPTKLKDCRQQVLTRWNTRAVSSCVTGVPQTPPATKDGSVPERETFWLLEMVGHQKYALYTSQRNAFVHSWTEDVWQAGRFRDERDAHEAWRMLEKAERERWKPVEHMFINKPDAATTSLPRPGRGGDQ